MRIILVIALLSVSSAFADEVDAGTVMKMGPEYIASQVVPMPLPDTLDLPTVCKAIYTAIMTKDWGKLIFVLVMGLVFVSRKFGGKLKGKVGTPLATFLKSKLGGVFLTFALAFSGMLATSWAPGIKLDGSAALNAMYVGFMAAGGWTVLKNLLQYFGLWAPDEAPISPAPVP